MEKSWIFWKNIWNGNQKKDNVQNNLNFVERKKNAKKMIHLVMSPMKMGTAVLDREESAQLVALYIGAHHS